MKPVSASRSLRQGALRPGAHLRPTDSAATSRYLGIDVGAETVKLVELFRSDDEVRLGRRVLLEHGKKPGTALQEALRGWHWDSLTAAAVTGRFSRLVDLPRVPVKQAQIRGCRFVAGAGPATVVSIGSHGFSVLELRAGDVEVFRENSRCSQGTGNFLRQLVERFSLTIEEASALCDGIERPVPLSGRCPVILKTDMTHLANKGEDRARILAGLFDAVCENVMVLIKAGSSPNRVVLIGGVSRAPRVQRFFRDGLADRGMNLVPLVEDDALFLEAIGCALDAAEHGGEMPSLDALWLPSADTQLEVIAPLSDYLHRVRRLQAPRVSHASSTPREWILGFDIGSTGSKAVALDPSTKSVFWQGYRQTLGDPVGAAQALWRQFCGTEDCQRPVRAVGITGSGREIVGSLMSTCYGQEAVFVLNEIAAHAAGAVHCDPRVDTIFEIGGQDAKYIRLADARVVDCAMNEACSAGTGSFIEEQGRKFAGVRDVVELSHEALRAQRGVSLGQHCSVFMAEVIDEAVASGVESPAIIAGLYDSIVQNYLHRVKGSRSVGQVIFCQGMPFASDALAAAVARQTGSEVIVPPDPGTVGALGIALLTAAEVGWQDRGELDPERFLGARIDRKGSFACKATVGCGGPGNRCRIESITTVVAQQQQRFNWGGACALYDKGVRRRKLPDRAPDPFREREQWVADVKQRLIPRSQGPTISLADEFMLKGLFPFFATFLHELGCDLKLATPADGATLRRGIQGANVPFCAPMQLFHGISAQMAAEPCDFVFVPMVRSLPRSGTEPHAVTCPIVQASPHILRWDLRIQSETVPRASALDRVSIAEKPNARAAGDSTRLAEWLVPVIDAGADGLTSQEFLAGCEEVARRLGVRDLRWREAHGVAVRTQEAFDQHCRDCGERALRFCQEHGVVPVVVLGRPYTIYHTVLNSNVPALLREQGALPIPVDCFPLADDTPVFVDVYWGYAQRMLRVAEQVRRTPGLYSLYCSNYSCGPDSFNLHFYAYLMEGKPFVVIETDGHAGDAGTKTRIEAFLYCVQQDLNATSSDRPANDFARLRVSDANLTNIERAEEAVLVPLLGPAPAAFVACLRGIGIQAETLPFADAEALRLGRRYTSGKECLPLCMTLGLLLQRVQRDPNPRRKFVFGMPGCQGPCRFGVYNLLNLITLERLGLQDRVRIWAPQDRNYFDGLPPGFSTLLYVGFMASDLLLAALLDVRPRETMGGRALEIHDRYARRLLGLLEAKARGDLSAGHTVWQVISSRLFGVTDLLREAAEEFNAAGTDRLVPTVLMVGEIFARCNAFANDGLVEKLEERGLRVRLSPFVEWLEYADYIAWSEGDRRHLADRLKSRLQARIRHLTYGTLANCLGWPIRAEVGETIAAADSYLPEALRGEAVLTVGGPLHEWHAGLIDAVVNVGPHECMPSKIAEAQLFHIAERERLLSLSLPLNGDSIDPEILDNFAFEVQHRFRARSRGKVAGDVSV